MGISGGAKRAVRRAVNAAGFDLVSRKPDVRRGLSPYATDPFGCFGVPELKSAIALAQTQSMIGERRMLSLAAIVKDLERRRVPGALVECGVWKGGAALVMAAAHVAYGGEPRNLHLFDAFEDIVEPDPAVDGERALYEVETFAGRSRETLTGALKPLTGLYDGHGGPGEAGAVRDFVSGSNIPPERVHIHVGYFQGTLPRFQPEPIALLRIDGDWKASTAVCLEHLADLVSEGGYIIVDDYGAYDGCKAAVDEFLAEREPVLMHWADVECVYFQIPKRRSA